MTHAVLTEIVLVIAASVVVAAVLRRLAAPPVVGFILAGVLIGPGGLGLVKDRHQIEVLAELGVILLLFTVGLKLRLRDLWTMRGTALGGGALQVVGTAAAAGALAVAIGGEAIASGVTWGLLVALSSTALVLWLLEDSGVTASKEGRAIIAVLLFQDLAVVPILLLLPVLAGVAGRPGEIAWFLGRTLAVLAVVVVVGRVLFPRLAARVVATGSRELFTLTAVLVAVGTALVVGRFGVSAALGAFLAGMVISESEFVGRMVSDITPLRDVFNSLFFVSMGMLLDTSLWLEEPLLMVGLLAAVLAGKAALAGVVGWASVGTAAGALTVGLGLAQIGEFSFIAARQAHQLGLLDNGAFRMFLGLAVPSMMLTPLLLAGGRRVAARVEARSAAQVASPAAGISDHVVIVGYGVNGHNVAHALRMLEVAHVVIDLNPHTVEQVTAEGGRALYGDARRDAVLAAAGVPVARALISAIPDAASTREVVAAARKANPDLIILARTRYVREVEPLGALGADQVIPEEFETSLELTGRVLALYGAPRRVVEREKGLLRARQYRALRESDEVAPHPSLHVLLEHTELFEARVGSGSPADGRSLRELDLRGRSGATVIAVERDDEVLGNPGPEFRLAAGDVLVLMGSAAEAAAARAVLTEP